MNLTIRGLTRADKKNIEVFNQIHDIVGSSFTGIELPPHHSLDRMYQQGEVWIAETEHILGGIQHIAGFAIVTERNHEPYISVIAVRPAWRGKGIASNLLAAIEGEAFGTKKHFIELTCKLDNATAQRQYLKAGYRVHRIVEGFYGPEGNGLVMRRTIC